MKNSKEKKKLDFLKKKLKKLEKKQKKNGKKLLFKENMKYI